MADRRSAPSTSVQSRTTIARVRDNDSVGVSRLKPGHLFFITLSLNEGSFYPVIRQDFVECFEGVVTYCCAIEKSSEQSLVSFHLHCFLEFADALHINDLRNYIVACFPEFKLDIQACRSKRNVLKYISKEDKLVYYNCSSKLLHFNYRAYMWATSSNYFKFSDDFVMEHRNQYRFLQKYFYEVKKDVLNDFKCFNRVSNSYFGWALEVAVWWNDMIKNKFIKKRKQLYLFGLSNVGKSSYIETIIGYENLKFIFYPGVGKFFMQDFDCNFHKVIVFEEFEIKYHCVSMLKRLLEGRSYAYPVKCEGDRVIIFNGPIIFVSNDNNITDEALINRLLIVNAETKFWEQEICQIPKAEEEEIFLVLSQ